jgi:HSP90 family molecular chaperone
LELTDGKFVTTADYLEGAKETHENTVYYTSDKAAQAQYVSMFETQGMQVAVFERQLDTQFLSMIESYNGDVKYVRIDADVAGALKSDEAAAEAQKVVAECGYKVLIDPQGEHRLCNSSLEILKNEIVEKESFYGLSLSSK